MNAIESILLPCPFCGETIELVIDCSVERQSYIEDCPVCCRPIDVEVIVDDAGIPVVEASAEI